jgi:hypothetical protein
MFSIRLNSVGFVLFVIFMVLKLTKTIDWSWWLITAPVWIPLGSASILWIISGILFLIAAIAKWYNNPPSGPASFI